MTYLALIQQTRVMSCVRGFDMFWVVTFGTKPPTDWVTVCILPSSVETLAGYQLVKPFHRNIGAADVSSSPAQAAIQTDCARLCWQAEPAADQIMPTGDVWSSFKGASELFLWCYVTVFIIYLYLFHSIYIYICVCVCSEVVVLYGHHKTLVSFRRAPSGEPRVNQWCLLGAKVGTARPFIQTVEVQTPASARWVKGSDHVRWE